MRVVPRHDPAPDLLRIVEHVGHELNLRLFPRGIFGAHWCSPGADAWLDAEVAEEVAAGDQAQGENHHRPSNTESSAEAP